MAFTHVDSDVGSGGSSATTVPVTLQGVAVGDLIVAFVTWEDASRTPAVSDGTSSFNTSLTEAASGAHGKILYLLSSVASGNVTYTVDFGSATAYPKIFAAAFRPEGTVTYQSEGTGTLPSGTSASTSQFSLTGSGAWVSVAGFAAYSTVTVNSRSINGVASDGSVSSGANTIWYRLLASTFTNGVANITFATSTAGGICAAAFNDDGVINPGELLGTLSGSGASVTDPSDATGSVPVTIDDVIRAVFVEQDSLTVTAVTDNLGNTYAAANAGTDAGAVTGREFYSIVTNAGTLTAVHFDTTASSNNWAAFADAYRGPFSAIDANPANITSDATSPFGCPASGTLAQADELVLSWGAANQTDAWSATSPNLLAGQVTSFDTSTISVPSVSVTNFTTSDGTGPTVTFPTGAMSAGDWIYIFGGHYYRAGQSIGPTGGTWETVYSENAGGSTNAFGCWRQQWNGSDTQQACYGSGTSGDGCVYGRIILRGSDAIRGSVIVATGSSTNPNPGTITTVAGDCVLIAAQSAVSDSSPGTVTSYTTVNGNINTTLDMSMSIGHRLDPATSENPAAWSAWSSGNWRALAIAVTPGAINKLRLAAGQQVVAATTSVAPEFTAATNPTQCILGTTSFKLGAGAIEGDVAESSGVADAPSAIGSLGVATSESVTATDAPSTIATLLVSAIESVAVTETTDASLAVDVSIAESAEIADASAGTLATAEAATEAVAIADDLSAIASMGAAADESIAAGDAPSATADVGAAVSESIVIADTPSATLVTSASVDESAESADEPSGGLASSADVSESSAVADVADGVAGQPVDTAETTGVADTVAATLIASVAQDESIAADDAQFAIAEIPTAAAESVAVSDATDRTAAHAGDVAETTGIADTPASTYTTLVAVDESIAIADQVSAGQQTIEIVAIVDDVSATASMGAAVAETAAIGDSPSGALITGETLAETAAVADTSSAAAVIPASVAESIAAADAQSVTVTISSGVSESVAATDASSAVLVATAGVSESGEVADDTSATAAIVAAVAETASTNDEASATRVATAAVSEAATVADTSLTAAAMGAAVTEIVAVADTAGTGEELFETFAVADTISATVSYATAVAESVAGDDQSSTTTGWATSVAETAGAQDASDASRVLHVGVDEFTGISDARSVTAITASNVVETVHADDDVYSPTEMDATISEILAAMDSSDAIMIPGYVKFPGEEISGSIMLRGAHGETMQHHIEGRW